MDEVRHSVYWKTHPTRMAKRISEFVANQRHVFKRRGNNLILKWIYYSAQFDNCANCAVHLHTRHNHKRNVLCVLWLVVITILQNYLISTHDYSFMFKMCFTLQILCK